MSGSYSGRDPRKLLCAFLAIIIGFSFAFNFIEHKPVNADVSAYTSGTNFWTGGGNITVNVSGCTGYTSVTVVVEFSEDITNAYGWNADTFSVNGRRVTATVYADGDYGWVFSSGGTTIGIQVDGPNFVQDGPHSAWVVDYYGSGAAIQHKPCSNYRNLG